MASINPTRHFLKKLEELFEGMGYTIRYAKGNFQSGYCMVENQKIAVINKFFETEGRVGVLMEILDQLEIEDQLLDEKNLKTWHQVKKRSSAVE